MCCLHVHFYEDWSCSSASESICDAHTYTLTERQRSAIRKGITCHGECLSGAELEPVLGESIGISPFAAQQTVAAAQAWPSTVSGSTQNAHTYTQTSPDAHMLSLDICSPNVKEWACLQENRECTDECVHERQYRSLLCVSNLGGCRKWRGGIQDEGYRCMVEERGVAETKHGQFL